MKPDSEIKNGVAGPRQVAHEPAGEGVPRAGGVDDLAERQRRRGEHAPLVKQERAGIAALEQEQAAINRQLAEGSIYRSDPARAQALQEELAQTGAKLAESFARWENLETRANAIAAPLK